MSNYQQLLLTKSNNCGFMPTINAGLYTINQQLLRYYKCKPAIITSLPVSLLSRTQLAVYKISIKAEILVGFK